MANSFSMPQMGRNLYISYLGTETDLIFNRGVDLPGFAAYPLLNTEHGRLSLRGCSTAIIELAQKHDVGVILDSTTWIASRDRGAKIGINPEELAQLNRQAIELIVDIRNEYKTVDIVLCAQAGPRDDGYAPESQMTIEEAENYHSEQIQILSDTDADFICGATLCYPEEAIGIVHSCTKFGKPSVISFTVETDGCLPTGYTLKQAINAVDEATEFAACYFMINCAHPDHFMGVLEDEPWVHRIKGVIANASRCSHAELDNAVTLDDGSPFELGNQLASLRRIYPHISVLGGCCGTDMRHMQSIVETATHMDS